MRAIFDMRNSVQIEPNGNRNNSLQLFGTANWEVSIGALVRDTDGHLYGVASGGGVYGFGVVFKLDPAGHETQMYSFTGGSTDGSYPRSLMRTPDGDFYGTTATGGAFNLGTVFKIDLNGVETVVHNFGGPSDGAEPLGRLIADPWGTCMARPTPAAPMAEAVSTS